MSCVTCCAVLLEPQLLDIMIVQFRNEKLVIMALYRSPLTVTLWPSSFLKKYGPMIPPAHKAHQTMSGTIRKNKLDANSFSEKSRVVRLFRGAVGGAKTFSRNLKVIMVPERAAAMCFPLAQTIRSSPS
ncbi:hypothetical protein TNCV_4573531 [Trichonephila clavipes]|nr:hypothetical protein TNCV_4573531 [Trichonephila clavipes]